MMSLMGQLGSLEAAGLVRVAQIEPDLEYLFRHSLVQDAVYSSLLEDDRSRLHLLVGETIEELYPDQLNEYAGMLARHFQNAGQDDKAHKYFIMAGKAALESYANKEAEHQFTRALSLTCCETERAALLSGLGEALYRQSRFDEALQAWGEGIALYQDAGFFDGVARLYARSARIAWYMGDHAEALRLSKEGLDVVSGTPDSPEMAMLLHETARSCYFNGLMEKARYLCHKALQMAEKFDDIAGQADTLATYGVLKEIPRDEALAALQKSLELSLSAGYLGIAMRAYHNLAAATGEQEGGREASREYFKKAAALGRQRGVASEEHYSLSGAVGYARAAGDLAEAEEYIQRMEELSKTLVDPASAEFVNKSHRAALYWMTGKWDDSLALARECYQEAVQKGDAGSIHEIGSDLVYALLELDLYGQLENWDEIESVLDKIFEISGEKKLMWPYLQLTVLRARQMRVREARDAFDNAREFLDEKPSMWRDSYLGHAEAELATAEGRYPDAISILEGIVASYARVGARWSWARTLHDWAEVHIKCGSPADYERARALLREAQTLYEDMGAERHAQWMDVRLGKLREKTFKLALASERDSQELARAAQIQGSFLPENPPKIPGWQIAVTLEPARQTSGDFYDFMPLSKGRWGIIVADVADKGTAAALFMTSSRSLIRTYAPEYEMWPEIVLSESNRRLLADTRSGLFVTVFYGVLDPATGVLTYANAGHNPPFLVQTGQDDFLPLTRTGTPLGVFDEATWDQASIQMNPGDMLILYTDGVTDAQNAANNLYGEEGLKTSIEKHRSGSGGEVHQSILDDVHQFVGDAPQFDDITLMVLKREAK